MLYINTMKLTHTLGNGSQLFKGKFKQIDEPVTEKEKRKLKYDCQLQHSCPNLLRAQLDSTCQFHFKILQIINTTSITQCNFLVLF